MRNVASCALGRRSPHGVVKMWATDIDSATQTTLVVVHELADDRSDLPDQGGYSLVPFLTLSNGGEVPCDAIDLPVGDPYAT